MDFDYFRTPKGNRELFDAILSKLEDNFEHIPQIGIIAGQAVCSAFCELNNIKIGSYKYKDIDVFCRRSSDDDSYLNSILSGYRDRHKPYAKIKRGCKIQGFNATKQAISMGGSASGDLLEIDDFEKIIKDGYYINSVFYDPVFRDVNYVVYDHIIRKRDETSIITLLNGFDLNMVRIGISRQDKIVDWTVEFEDFINTLTLKISNLSTPANTALRLMKKTHEYPGVHCDIDLQMKHLQTMKYVMNDYMLKEKVNLPNSFIGPSNFPVVDEFKRKLNKYWKFDDVDSFIVPLLNMIPKSCDEKVISIFNKYFDYEAYRFEEIIPALEAIINSFNENSVSSLVRKHNILNFDEAEKSINPHANMLFLNYLLHTKNSANIRLNTQEIEAIIRFFDCDLNVGVDACNTFDLYALKIIAHVYDTLPYRNKVPSLLVETIKGIISESPIFDLIELRENVIREYNLKFNEYHKIIADLTPAELLGSINVKKNRDLVTNTGLILTRYLNDDSVMDMIENSPPHTTMINLKNSHNEWFTIFRLDDKIIYVDNDKEVSVCNHGEIYENAKNLYSSIIGSGHNKDDYRKKLDDVLSKDSVIYKEYDFFSVP